MATAEVSVLPMGREGASVGDVIALMKAHLEGQDRVAFEMHAMGTSLEGEVPDILALVEELHGIPLKAGLSRSYTVLKLDERTDREQGLADKVRSLG